MNQRQASIVERYNRSDKDELYQVYGSASSKKWEAWRRCLALKSSHNATDLRIIGANRYQFSVGCKFTDDEGNKCLLYITKAGIETIVLEEV